MIPVVQGPMEAHAVLRTGLPAASIPQEALDTARTVHLAGIGDGPSS